MHDHRGPFAGLFVGNTVCRAGSSVRHTSAVCMTRKHLLEMLCA